MAPFSCLPLSAHAWARAGVGAKGAGVLHAGSTSKPNAMSKCPECMQVSNMEEGGRKERKFVFPLPHLHPTSKIQKPRERPDR